MLTSGGTVASEEGLLSVWLESVGDGEFLTQCSLDPDCFSPNADRSDISLSIHGQSFVAGQPRHPEIK